jgi:hypothetical protein
LQEEIEISVGVDVGERSPEVPFAIDRQPFPVEDGRPGGCIDGATRGPEERDEQGDRDPTRAAAVADPRRGSRRPEWVRVLGPGGHSGSP